MSNLHRTQIYIGEDQMHQLKTEAKKEHVPVSQLIRKAIEFFFNAKTKSMNWDNDPIIKGIGTLKLNVTDASINHDNYLYGVKKRR